MSKGQSLFTRKSHAELPDTNLCMKPFLSVWYVIEKSRTFISSYGPIESSSEKIFGWSSKKKERKKERVSSYFHPIFTNSSQLILLIFII